MRIGLIFFSAAAIASAFAAPARAGDYERELVPEINAYFKVSDRARVFVLGAVTQKLNETDTDGELGAFLDYTLAPIFRPQLREADWARARYFWVRVGYTFGGLREGLRLQALKNSTVNTLSLEASGRWLMGHEVWLVHRGRVDLRDLDGESSQRYRYRLGAEREFNVSGTVVVPYAQAEFFYDTRFDSWSRRVFQVGAEVEINSRWRIEPYYARQNDTSTSPAHVDRLGLVLKYFH